MTTRNPVRAPVDVVAGAALAALGTYVVVTASSWNFFDASDPGPSFFPILYGLAMLVASLALVVDGARRREREGMEGPDKEGLVRALGLWTVFVGTIVAMWIFGFPIALGILIIFFCRFIFRHSLIFTAIATVLSPIGFHIVFTEMLGVELPVGWLTGI